MRIIIELPTWMGDSVMTSPAIDNLCKNSNDLKIFLIGSQVSIEVLNNHPNVVGSTEMDKNYFKLYKQIKGMGHFDLFISFRSSFRSKFIKFVVSSKLKYQYDKTKYFHGHQVEKCNNFINDCLKINSNAGHLILHQSKIIKNRSKKILGINPGASYGSAKRWYPKKFAQVASVLSSEYDIVIFGGPNEKNIAFDIESNLIRSGVRNYQNLSDQNSIKELMKNISDLDLFITADSGPMHIAAAFQVPTVSIFGPTKDYETSQWMNKQSVIVKKDLDCQPCMKRKCPLNHHNCMKKISPKDILEAVNKLN